MLRGLSQPCGIRNRDHAHLRACLKQWILAVLFCVGPAGSVAAQSQAVGEYEVKAAYLYNFAHSAQWPAASLPTHNAPFVIGVVGGEKGFLDKLRSVIDGRTIESHPLVAKAVSSESEMQSCQVVFFHRNARRRAPSAVAVLQSTTVLLIGEDASFLREGGMINLFLENGRIRFEINRQALDSAGIRLSPALLQLARPPDGSPTPALGALRQLRRNEFPEYPKVARRLNIKGAVRLEAVVRRDGTVSSVRVLGGNPVLAEALSRAVMNWKYEPSAKETVEQVEYTFVQ
ncbi:MAG: TonB family protein [Acidobacteriia bacterium]|nr:TonB family protein [Terriglobia bacterium]